MRAIFIFTPYILIPFIVALLFRRFNHLSKSLTYVLTAFIIFFYPFGFFWVDDYFNPPSGFRCGNPRFFFFLANTIIHLPITLLIQYIFNRILLTKKATYFSTEDEGEM